jgi:transcriptional regulator GlxA family with amidase domain
MKLAFVLLPEYSMIAFSSLIEPVRLAKPKESFPDSAV